MSENLERDNSEFLLLVSTSLLEDMTVREFWKKLDVDPQNRSSRIVLLGHYFLKQVIEKRIQEERQILVKWFIDNDPACPLLRLPQLSFELSVDTEDKETLLKEWASTLERFSENADVYINAAHFYEEFGYLAKAEQLLCSVLQRNPNSTSALQYLIECCSKKIDLSVNSINKSKNQMIAERVLEHINRISDMMARYLVLEQLCEFLIASGFNAIAKQFAFEIIEKADKMAPNWYKPLALHQANIILGRIALEAGDIDSAKQLLLKAGDVMPQNSPQLVSFGPNLTLAKALVHKGEIETVISFLNECRNWWLNGTDYTGCWLQELRETGFCDFAFRKPIC